MNTAGGNHIQHLWGLRLRVLGFGIHSSSLAFLDTMITEWLPVLLEVLLASLSLSNPCSDLALSETFLIEPSRCSVFPPKAPV